MRGHASNGQQGVWTPAAPDAGAAATVARRTVGFHRDWEYVGEATVQTASGDYVTVREYGHTPEGAMARAKAAAAARMTGRKRACGFTADGFRDETRNRAGFPVGFAAAA